jgi:hypothetical protein
MIRDMQRQGEKHAMLLLFSKVLDFTDEKTNNN